MKKLIGILILSGLLVNVPIYGFTQNIALNKPVVTSSVSGSRTGNLAVDGSTSTRWSSVASDPQWIYVDLGSQYNLTSVKITWSSAYGKNYTIDVSNNATSWSTIKSISNNTSLTNTNSVTGTGRYVRIYGTQRGTTSGYSIYELQVVGSLTPCGTPTGLTSSSITNTTATVTWTAVTGAVTYNLQWKPSSSSTWAAINGITTASTDLTTLIAGTSYDFQVQTVCSVGSSSFSPSTSFATTATCGIPTGLSSLNITNTTATVTWTPVTGAVTYNLQWKPSSSSTWATVNGVTGTSSDLSTLVSGTSYDFQVQTVCSAGSSSYSAVASFTTTNTTVATGKSYYFSSSGDDSRTSTEAQSPSTPWKTISKLNSFFSSLQPGDKVYFKSGDTFYGAISFSKSGSSSGALFFGAYGTGNKPIITGLADASGWKSIGTNLWESDAITDGQSTAMIVTVNGTPYPMGRWPNATDTWGGFRTISSTNGTSSVTDANLPSSPNWTGATIVMRKNQYVIEKGTVTSQSGNTLNFSSSWNQYSVTSGYGYFIENTINTLDMQNEWYYNPSTKKLDIYSSSTPANVKISTVNVLLDLTSRSYLSFDNLDIRGSLGRLTVITGSSNITFTNCDLSNAGRDAIYGGSGTSYFDFENCTINNSNHAAITLDGGASNTIIRNNSINNSAMNPGMLDNYWLTAAVYVAGSNNTIEKNSVQNSGYIAIAFAKGSNFIIKNNFVKNFESVLDEAGGIYTYRGSDPNTYSNNVIDGNIVLDGIGATGGKTSTKGDAQGIHIDGNSQNVTVINNSVANVSMYGILLMDAHEINVLNNTVYNCGSGAFAIIHNSGSNNNSVRNVKIRSNKLVMTVSTTLGTWSYQTETNDLLQFGTSDSNVVANPLNDVNAFYTFDGTNYRHQTVAQWQTFSGQDMHSRASPKTVSSISSLRFEYNATSSDKTVSLGAAYIDIAGTSFPSSITLAPYTSAVLILASANTTQSMVTAEVTDESNIIEKPAFTVYPNPVRDNFVLQLNNSQMGKMKVEIVNQGGSIIRSYLFNKDQLVNQVTVPANDLSSGVYFIQVQIGTWSDRRKIVKF